MALFACAIAGALAFPAASRAQDQPPPNAIGKITGPDLTVESGAAAGNGLPSSAPSIFVLRGSSITVHSGQAQMTLFSGGTLDICGPAKFTVLESAGSVTVALNFGKIRVQLPAERALKIYTPTIIATPLEIGGGLRDVTVGLDLQDSLCVHPSTGALQLESQFTGEKIIVPENSEFFLAAGKLAPVPGTPGSCQCDSSPLAAAQEPPAPVPPAIAVVNSKPIPLPPPHPGETPPPASEVAPPDAGAPAVTYVVPVETPAPPRPAAPTPAAPSSPPPAATPSPVVHVSTPALSFSAPSGLAPTQPSVETLVLVTQARVEPEYEFRGQVSPEFVSAMQSALGEAPGAAAAAPKPPKPSHAAQSGPAPGSSNAPASAPSSPSAAPSTPAPQPKPKKKGGFWSSLKKVFVGSSD